MARSRRDLPFDEWRAEQMRKAPTRGGVQTPVSPASTGMGMLGPPGNTSSRAPAGPPARRSGNLGSPAPNTTFGPNIETKYTGERPDQPDPWIEDVDMGANWYTPMQPVWPFGPPAITRPRDWDYPVGYNLQYIQPRMELMGMLRGMRDSWGVLSTIISTRQDQLLRIPWTIQRRDKPRATNKTVDEMRKFFRRPDGKLSYSQWTRLVLDDLLVLDAPTIYFSRDRAGRPLTAERLDPITVFPLIDDAGRRPDSVVEIDSDGLTYLRRQPAFQQIIKGLPMIDLDESELMYVPMRPRANMPMFGYPPTEQIYIEASAMIRKTLYQLNFWKEGTLPDLIVNVPDGWSPRQIAMFQAHFDAVLAGNLVLKSKVRFLPGGMKPFDVKNSSGQDLYGQWDETMIRLACYAYSVSPTPFVKQMNRACYSADTETLTENGWRYFDQIKKDEAIATVNPTTGCLEYRVANKFFVYQIEDEPLIRFLTKNVDVLVTPEHDMWMRLGPGNRHPTFSKVKAKDAPNSQFFFAATVNYDGGFEVPTFTLPSVVRWADTVREDISPEKIIPMNTWLEFLGYFISEGGLSADYNVFTLSQHMSHVGQNKFSAHHADFGFILGEIGVNTHYYIDGEQKRWTIGNRQLCEWLRNNVGVYSHVKRIPREFLQLHKNQLKILFAALMAGDGTWDERPGHDSGSYSTTSRQLADDVQELAFMLGYRTSVGVHYEAHGNRKTCYRVLISNRREHSLMGSEQKMTACGVREEIYSGAVYCFDVPNHLFITRRNGKIGIHGNTAQNQQQTSEAEGLFPLMSFWKDDIIDPILQERFGYEDLEFVFLPRPEPDLEKQSKIHDMKIRSGEYSINEARDESGLEPIAGGDVHLIYAGNAVIPLENAAQGDAMPMGGGDSQATPSKAKPGGSLVPKPTSGQPQRGPIKPETASPIPKPGTSKTAALAWSPLGSVRKASKSEVRAAAREATGGIDNYSHLVLHTGNFKKGHVWIQGLNISIENRKGSKRGEKDQHGKKWQVRMPAPYGYIRGTIGADGMQMDVYLGKHPKSPTVWVIDQDEIKNGENRGFDEHKVMLGYKRLRRALKDWEKSHFEDTGLDQIHDVVELSVEDFKSWLKDGDLKSPIADQGVGEVVLTQRDLKKADTISAATNLVSYDQGGQRKRKGKRKAALGPRWLQLIAGVA